ncbi:MAG: two pore domain potassium channel family protein, partial [Calditrichae bacterium]|nr:two pore domain potassium channel family protein [Calditrichia bacterium]
KRENLHRLLLVVVVLLVISSVGLFYFEPKVNNWTDALWWSIVTMTTVGYGDITPDTLGGKVIGSFVMVIGIGILGMLTATIASI